MRILVLGLLPFPLGDELAGAPLGEISGQGNVARIDCAGR